MMMWLLMWLNVSVAILNATLQLLVIYRFDVGFQLDLSKNAQRVTTHSFLIRAKHSCLGVWLTRDCLSLYTLVLLSHASSSAIMGGRSKVGFEVESKRVEIRDRCCFGSDLKGSRCGTTVCGGDEDQRQWKLGLQPWELQRLKTAWVQSEREGLVRFIVVALMFKVGA